VQPIIASIPSGNVSKEVLGQFGDFVGGTLNPLLSLLALAAILWTIILQSEELKATREELKRFAEAQREQAENLRLQLTQIQDNAKTELTVRMFERWTSEQMRNHRMLAWGFFEKRYSKDFEEQIPLYQIARSKPEVSFAISQVNQFLADLCKLTLAGRLDGTLVNSLLNNSVYPWYDFAERYVFYPPEQNDAESTSKESIYRRGVEDWHRTHVLGLKPWFEERRRLPLG